MRRTFENEGWVGCLYICVEDRSKCPVLPYFYVRVSSFRAPLCPMHDGCRSVVKLLGSTVVICFVVPCTELVDHVALVH